MTESDGVVVRLEGEYAWVRAAERSSACGACAGKEGCNASGTGALLDGVSTKPERLLRLINTIKAHPGDAVLICASESTVMRAVWLAYVVPLLLAVGGALVFQTLTGSEGLALFGMLCGLAGGILVMRRSGFATPRSTSLLTISFKRSPLSFHEV